MSDATEKLAREFIATARSEDDAWRQVRALRTVLADRERELLELKGPCRNESCRLHRSHSGPCDVAVPT